MKKAIKLIGVAFLICALAVTAFVYSPGHLDGLWRNHYFGDCLCDSRNVYLFEDGNITLYSSNHLTDPGKGTYRQIGDGRWEVHYTDDDWEMKWIVTPRRFHWMVPKGDAQGNDMILARLFHRSTRSQSDRDLIQGAASRDARIRKAIAEKEANKSIVQSR